MKHFLLLFLINFSFAGWLGSPGNDAFSFSQRLGFAQGISLSGSGLASAEGLWALDRNPAGLANTSSPSESMFGFHHDGLETRLYQGYFKWKLPFWSFAGGAQYLRYEELEEINQNAELSGRTFQPFQSLISVSAVYQINKISIGHTFKLFSSQLTQFQEDQTAFAIAGDFGIRFQKELNAPEFGLVIKNFGRQIRSHTKNGENGAYLNSSISAGFSFRPFFMPRAKVSSDLETYFFSDTRLRTSIDYYLNKNLSISLSAAPTMKHFQHSFNKVQSKKTNFDELEESWPLATGINLTLGHVNLIYALKIDMIKPWSQHLGLSVHL
jgi:hypothetical protein